MMGEFATYSPSSFVRQPLASAINGEKEKNKGGEGKRKRGLTDENGPEVDEDEQGDVGEFLEWEDVREDVVGYTLGETIQWVKRVAGVRRGHDPFVMGFMQDLVNARVVQAAMDPVDEEIGEGDEEGEL